MSLNVELLEESFDRVKPHAKKFSASFYHNLLTDCPQLQPLFARTKLEEQEEKLIMSLVLIVENLRKPDCLATILKNLGERHVSYGTLQEHYPLVGAALLKTFKSFLGSDWTPEVERGWTDAYKEIVNLMLAGAKSRKEVPKAEIPLQLNDTPSSPSFSPTVVANTSSSTNHPEPISQLDNELQPVAKLVVMDNPSVASSSSLNYAESASELDNLPQLNPQPAIATTSSFQLKLLMPMFVVTVLLSVGFVYYHFHQKQDNSKLNGSTSSHCQSLVNC